ncbi:DUF3797 domain-containing protein [Jeotgalibacillus haloalkalitolerans]|uniref:DUF3797 domain-containing protein n=1 Tax=Jeotgalibacillus haloalkalitolerans TaxID=3104292 RepID=UPI0033905DA6
MSLERLMELSKQHAECQKCGSSEIGNGSGMVYVDDVTYRRMCKCGWKIEVIEKGGSEYADASSQR